MKPIFLTAEWNNLIMANYFIDPEILLPYLPPATELDIYKGKCYVSLIGFMFEKTKVLGVKIPFHINFEEVNLRFYVRHFDNGEWKRGAVFIKEIVPKIAISLVANTLYNEKYSTMQMQHYFKSRNEQIELGYSWLHQKKWNKLEAIVENKTIEMKAKSEEEFIAEHYWGYSKFNDKTTIEYAVRHPRWKLFTIKKFSIDVDFIKIYGDQFSFLQNATPESVFVAQGSAIQILNKRIIKVD